MGGVEKHQAGEEQVILIVEPGLLVRAGVLVRGLLLGAVAARGWGQWPSSVRSASRVASSSSSS